MHDPFELRTVLGDLVSVNHRLTRLAASVTGSTESPAIWRTIAVLRDHGPMRLGELATVSRAAIVVEDRWADVFRLQHVAPSMVAEMLAAAQVRYPNVPIVFCETRPLAQEWAYRFLGAALAYADEEALEL